MGRMSNSGGTGKGNGMGTGKGHGKGRGDGDGHGNGKGKGAVKVGTFARERMKSVNTIDLSSTSGARTVPQVCARLCQSRVPFGDVFMSRSLRKNWPK